MTKEQEEVRLMKAFCDENRLQILRSLRDGEKCACKLLEELNVQQPTLSHHMKILCDAGVVAGRKDGKWMHYRLDENGCSCTLRLLADVLGQAKDKPKRQCSCKGKEPGC